MQLDTSSLKPRICVICKRDLAKIASPNDCVYCILYQTACFCPGKCLSKRTLILTFFIYLNIGYDPNFDINLCYKFIGKI